MKKAIVRKIFIGRTVFDGLELPDGSLGIAVTQMAYLFPHSINRDHASRKVRSLLGKRRGRLGKVLSELNSREVCFVSIPIFKKLVKQLSDFGDHDATEMLNKLFSPA